MRSHSREICCPLRVCAFVARTPEMRWTLNIVCRRPLQMLPTVRNAFVICMMRFYWWKWCRLVAFWTVCARGRVRWPNAAHTPQTRSPHTHTHTFYYLVKSGVREVTFTHRIYISQFSLLIFGDNKFYCWCAGRTRRANYSINFSFRFSCLTLFALIGSICRHSDNE